MTDPAHPVQTDTLTQLPMMTPHESLNLNTTRGLLAAVNGNPATEPGLVSIYDVHADCRHPVLDSTSLVARFGHESGFSPDGKTFYATSTALPSITAIDVTDPKHPHAIWQGNILAHGMTLSDDGNRAYVADPTGGDMLILDTSQIQAREPNPAGRGDQPPDLGLGFDPAERDPVHRERPSVRARVRRVHAGHAEPDRRPRRRRRRADHRHLRRDQAVRGREPAPTGRPAGRPPGRRQRPRHDSALRRATRRTTATSRRGVDPKIVACSFIASGLRVFDISDLLHPKEIGYFVAPTTPSTETRLQGERLRDVAARRSTSRAMRSGTPTAAPGFYVVRVDNGVWPGSG